MAVRFWGAVFYDGGCGRREEGGFVDEGFGALGYGFEGVVGEGWWESVERARGGWLWWG